MSLNFYDISNNQGDINNGLVPGDAVIIKATEGIGYTDPDCDANFQQAKAAGKLLGVYHFARPDGNPNGADEADWYVSQVKGYLNEAVLVLDWETGNTGNVAWAKAFLDRVTALTGIRPWIYMSQSVANSHDWSSVWGSYALWVAAYGTNQAHNGYTPSTNISANGNWNIAAWQYTSNGHLPGWGSALDLNVFYGDANVWHKFAGKAELPTPAPAPAPVPQPAPPVVPSPTPEPVVSPVIPEPIPVSPTPVSDTPTADDVAVSQLKSISIWQVILKFLLGFFGVKL